MNDLPPSASTTSVPPTTQPTPVTPAPASTPPATQIDDFKWVTHLSSLVVISITAAYSIGFLVVNTSLFDYGLVPYDFLQPRYISAGLLYFGATIGPTSITLFLIHITRKKLFGDKENAEIKSALTLLGVFLWQIQIYGGYCLRRKISPGGSRF